MSPIDVENKGDIEHLDRNSAELKDPVQSFIYQPGTDAEKRLVRKIDIRLMPMLWLMYVFNYVDRTNVS